LPDLQLNAAQHPRDWYTNLCTGRERLRLFGSRFHSYDLRATPAACTL
jgi:hypothetical protein